MPADYAQAGGRAGKVIVEGFVEFDYEITQLTVRHAGGTSFCDPIGHVQVDGDYRQFGNLSRCQREPRKNRGNMPKRSPRHWVDMIFGDGLFIRGDEVPEVSPALMMPAGNDLRTFPSLPCMPMPSSDSRYHRSGNLDPPLQVLYWLRVIQRR